MCVRLVQLFALHFLPYPKALDGLPMLFASLINRMIFNDMLRYIKQLRIELHVLRLQTVGCVVHCAWAVLAERKHRRDHLG